MKTASVNCRAKKNSDSIKVYAYGNGKAPWVFSGFVSVCVPFPYKNHLFVCKALEYFTYDCLKWKYAYYFLFFLFFWFWFCEQALAWKYVGLSLSALECHCYEFNNIQQIHKTVIYTLLYTITTYSLAHSLAWSLFYTHAYLILVRPIPSFISVLFLLLYPFSHLLGIEMMPSQNYNP